MKIKSKLGFGRCLFCFLTIQLTDTRAFEKFESPKQVSHLTTVSSVKLIQQKDHKFLSEMTIQWVVSSYRIRDHIKCMNSSPLIGKAGESK